MGNTMPLPAELIHDERDLKQWVSDQGLELVNVAPGRRRMGCDISIARTCITFSSKSIRMIGSKKLHLGVRRIDGEPALLVKPAGNFDLKCYRLSPSESRPNYSIHNNSLGKLLLDKGLKPGKYKLYKAKGGFLAKLM